MALVAFSSHLRLVILQKQYFQMGLDVFGMGSIPAPQYGPVAILMPGRNHCRGGRDPMCVPAQYPSSCSGLVPFLLEDSGYITQGLHAM